MIELNDLNREEGSSPKYSPLIDHGRSSLFLPDESQWKIVIFAFLRSHRRWESRLDEKALSFLDYYWAFCIGLIVLLLLAASGKDWPYSSVLFLSVFAEIFQMMQMNFYLLAKERENRYNNHKNLKEALQDIDMNLGTYENGTNFFIRTAIELNQDPKTKSFSFQLLSSHYERNLALSLNRYRRAETKVVNLVKSAIKWRTSNNGLDLLYSMTWRSVKDDITVMAILVPICLLAIGILVVAHVAMSSIINNDFFGIMLRIINTHGFLMSGMIFGFSAFESSIVNYLRCGNPEDFINTKKIFRGENEGKFLINIFDVKSLDPIINAFQV